MECVKGWRVCVHGPNSSHFFVPSANWCIERIHGVQVSEWIWWLSWSNEHRETLCILFSNFGNTSCLFFHCFLYYVLYMCVICMFSNSDSRIFGVLSFVICQFINILYIVWHRMKIAWVSFKPEAKLKTLLSFALERRSFDRVLLSVPISFRFDDRI